MGDVAARFRRSDGNASDNLIEVATVESAPKALLFVKDQESAGGTLI